MNKVSYCILALALFLCIASFLILDGSDYSEGATTHNYNATAGTYFDQSYSWQTDDLSIENETVLSQLFQVTVSNKLMEVNWAV